MSPSPPLPPRRFADTVTRVLVIGGASVVVATSSAKAQDTDQVRFNRDVRPILANHCFGCHGPDANARKAKLRLDTQVGAVAARKREAAVVPGDAERSLLVARIRHTDPSERMPPESTGKPLSSHQIELLQTWIEQGAKWQEHWSFEPLVQPAVPEGRGSAIDRFLAVRHRALGLEPAPPADPRTLIRRLHFDLVGLPPSADEVDAFVRDPSEARYRAIVDRLLASAHHAERLTMYWLDLVRYADSSGIHGDQVISLSPYRDWVIRSFHANKRFDVFTREQLAGDLLPGATLQQKVASGYNRLNMKTAEGGAQDAEYLAKYAADRVRTTSTVWLGSTLGCAECHDHKFDPFTTKDFYRFAAFFAGLEQKGYYANANQTGDWGSRVTVPTQEQEVARAQMVEHIESLEQEFRRSTPELRAAQLEWEASTLEALAEQEQPRFGPWSSIGPFKARNLASAHRTAFGPERANLAESYGGLRWVERRGWRDGRIHKLTGANSATYLYRDVFSSRAQEVRLSLGSDDSIKVWLNGHVVLEKLVTRGVQRGQEKPTLALNAGRNHLLMKICNGGGGYGFVFEAKRVGPPAEIVHLLKIERHARSVAHVQRLRNHYHGIAKSLASVQRDLAKARADLKAFDDKLTTTLVSKARSTPRVTRVLPQGNWMDKSGEVVHPGVPAFLSTARPTAANATAAEASSVEKTLTRLDLAYWITSDDNPLTARVFVNRFWKMCFGRGLSASLDDLGSKGDWPENLELLDWLAAEFRKDWNVRRVLRSMVLSAAYRRSSWGHVEARRRDPENREFARQGRFRHDAEVVRDVALAASGLLVTKVGGPSVKPYQPAGYWGQLNFPKRRWVHDKGENQYRRGLYTHWQRTFLHPLMRAFDAPTREECTAERPRSNTPLQALALLNDPTFVEAARVLAERAMRDGGKTFDSRLSFAFRRVLARQPNATEHAALRTLWRGEQRRYSKDVAAARALTSVGEAPVAKDLDPVEHAAWTAVARVLLNLHETITRF